LSVGPVATYELIEELSIGIDEGDSNYVFGTPSIGGVDNQGNIYVYDMANYRVSKFDSTGKFILAFGRKGEGPGEFKSAWVEVMDDHTIVASDPNNRRISVFNEKGELRSDFVVQGFKWAIGSDRNNHLILQGSETDYNNKISHKLFVRYSFGGEIIDTLFQIDQEVFAVTDGNSAASSQIKPFDVCIDNQGDFFIIFEKVLSKNRSQLLSHPLLSGSGLRGG